VTLSTQWRPQPPSISDPKTNSVDLWEPGREVDEEGMAPDEGEPGKKGQPDWVKRARDSFRFSTSYIDSNYRKQWDDSIRAFNNEHPNDSKYHGEVFKKRSNLFRPKTRAIIRKNEAAAAAAFFSNMDLIDVQASDSSQKEQLLSADVTKVLLQYRLTKTIPWFQLLCGAMQDANVQGACVSHIYWRFQEKYDEDGNAERVEDKPCIDLLPIENLRIDPSADWMDPVNTSPYLIELIPMYWCDVKDRMTHINPKGQQWKEYGASVAFSRDDGQDDSTRQARNRLSQDPTQQKRDISDYDIVWVHRHIHRWDGEDWEFYTLFSEHLLTDPQPLKKVVWHGQRPYVMGNVMLETHKPIPTSVPMLVKPLQDEANTVQNSRMDNVLFVLNKGYIAKRGKNVDLSGLIRNVPGRVILADDPEGDIKEQTWNDITQSAYLEQDRIDGDFSDLVGNYNPMQVQGQRSGRESTNTMRMLQGPTNLLTEYLLKTFVETWVQPVLRQLVMLEQHYESDMVLLQLAGQKAQVFQKYGVSQMSDAVLDKELTVTVNVGMGSTDPALKMQRFGSALQLFTQIVRVPPPGIDLKEVFKEFMALAGYQGGERFVLDGQDPTSAALTKQVQGLGKKLQQMQLLAKDKSEANKVKLIKTDKDNATKLALADKGHQSKARLELFKHVTGTEQAATDRQGQVQDKLFDAGQQQLQQQAQQPGQPLAQAPQKDPALEQIKESLALIVKSEDTLAQAISELAKSIHEDHEGSRHRQAREDEEREYKRRAESEKKDDKPRTRRVKARLPSGGEVNFEMLET
jgi:hypothetical protein